MRTLEVWFYDELVGTIAETRKGGRFSYASELVAEMRGMPLLSLSLPLKERAFGEEKTGAWFEGVLPEGARREEMARRFGISPYDWIGLLAEIGWECAGAVRVFERGDSRKHAGSYDSVSSEELAEKIANAPSRQPTPKSAAFRMSLGGFQDKMCVAMPCIDANCAFVQPEGVQLPLGDAASTHILKPEPRTYPGSALAEAWAMTVVSAIARSSLVAMLDLPNAPNTLVVERYDRLRAEGSDAVERIHQEDACQALGLLPFQKYAHEQAEKGDDPTYEKIASLLVRYAADPEEELAELFRQMFANLVLGNWDAHAKNISFLYEKAGVPMLAPMYDVVPIAEVEPQTRVLSLRVDGSLDPVEVTRTSILAEAGSWGIGGKTFESVLDDAIVCFEEGFAKARRRYPDAAERYERAARQRLVRFQ